MVKCLRWIEVILKSTEMNSVVIDLLCFAFCPLNCENEHLVLAITDETAAQAVVGAPVWCRGSSRLYRLVSRQ